MARKQFWAIRNEFGWERTHEKTKWPTDAIVRKWPELANDPIGMTALAPSSAENRPAERWAFSREVVGLGSAKRAADRLFSKLVNDCATEKARRDLVKQDPEQLIRARVASARDTAGRACTEIADALKNGHALASMMTKTWGTSIPQAMRRELEAGYWANIENLAVFGTVDSSTVSDIKRNRSKKEREEQEKYEAAAKRAKDGEMPLTPPVAPTYALAQSYGEALGRAIDHAKQERYPTVSTLFDRTALPDHLVNMLTIMAKDSFLEETRRLMVELDRVASAHAVEREIQEIRRHGPNAQVPGSSSS